MDMTHAGQFEVGDSPTGEQEEVPYQKEQDSGVFARMDAGLQSGHQAPESATVRQPHTCMYCKSLLDCPDAFQDPHAYQFHEGASKDSPTALRFSCLLCSTAMTWERAGHASGWT